MYSSSPSKSSALANQCAAQPRSRGTPRPTEYSIAMSSAGPEGVQVGESSEEIVALCASSGLSRSSRFPTLERQKTRSSGLPAPLVYMYIYISLYLSLSLYISLSLSLYIYIYACTHIISYHIMFWYYYYSRF